MPYPEKADSIHKEQAIFGVKHARVLPQGGALHLKSDSKTAILEACAGLEGFRGILDLTGVLVSVGIQATGRTVLAASETATFLQERD